MRQGHIDDGVALAPQTLTADANGATIDLADCDGLAILANVGASGDTLSGSVYLSLEIEHSDDGSTWEDVTDAEHVVDGRNSAFVASGTGIFDTIDAPAEDEKQVSIHYIGPKRYVRLVVNLTGTHSNGIPVGASYVKSFVRALPVT